MTFREDGRIQELLDENAALKKANAELAKKYASVIGSRFWQILIAVVQIVIASALFGFIVAFSDRIFFNDGDSKMIAREVAAQIRHSPRPVYDRQWAEYFTEKVVAPAYREGVRDAREEFEASRRAETQARPVLSADGRDLTAPPPSPPTLPLNTVVYGRIVSGDVQSYLFHAQAGERVVFRMQATVGSWLTPYIVITTERRSRLAESSAESNTVGGQGRFVILEHTFETSGTYIVFCRPTFFGTDGGDYALSARHR